MSPLLVGTGHVDLPLGTPALAQAGKRVVAIDVDKKRVAETNAGSMPFRDRGGRPVTSPCSESGNFHLHHRTGGCESGGHGDLCWLALRLMSTSTHGSRLCRTLSNSMRRTYGAGQLLGYVAQLLFYLARGNSVMGIFLPM